MVRFVTLSGSLLMLMSSTALHAQDILTIPVSNLEGSDFTVDLSAIEQSALDTTSLFGVIPVAGGGNQVDVDQNGLGNVGVIDQAGDFNTVGRVGTPALQEGDGNALFITQIGDSNDATVLNQLGDNNVLRLNQTGDVNRLDQLIQSVDDGIGSEANIAVILQSDGADTGARITQVTQSKTLAGQSNLLTVVQDDDSLIGGDNATITRRGGIRQIGAANTAGIEQIGARNRLFVLEQIGTLNTAGLRQEGDDNSIMVIDQRGSQNQTIAIVSGTNNALEAIRQDNILSGGVNLAALSIEGNDNGSVLGAGLSPFISGTSAFDVAVAQGVLNQVGGDNVVDIAVIGDANLFGTDQTGNDLFISAEVDGSGNSFAVQQLGDGSNAVIKILRDTGNGSSDDNDIGIRQSAESGLQLAENVATATVIGDENRLDLVQTGARNFVQWEATGDRNAADLSFTGDDNGTPALFGPADLAAVQAGTVSQIGTENVVSLTVLGSDNAFGIRQSGDDNRILGFMSGDGNAAAVSQFGQGNIADFSQSGRTNSVGISQ